MDSKLDSLKRSLTNAGRSVTRTPLGRQMAIGAGIGAVIAVPVPFVGFLTGAIVGAGIAAVRYAAKG